MHDSSYRPQTFMIPEIVQSERKAIPPVGMFVDGAGQVDLIVHSKHVFHGYDQESRRRVSEIFCHRRKFDSYIPLMIHGAAQCLDRAGALLAGLAGIDADCLLDREVAVVAPADKSREVVRPE